VKAAKSQQIVPNDRKHPGPVGIRVHQDGSESAVLTASATACRGHFTAVYKRSAVGRETEDSRKNPHDVVAGRLARRAKTSRSDRHAA
jgi:hypothetical protein